jgi:predicted ATPase
VKIQRFEIRHFKGLQEVVLDDCGGINAIVGKNNSGKSSVLHALDMAGLALSVQNWNMFQPKLEIKDLFANVGDFTMSLAFEDTSTIAVSATPDYGPRFNPNPTDAQRIKTVLVLPDVAGGMLRRRHHTPRNIIEQVENRNYNEINALEMLYAIKFYSQRSERGLVPKTYTDLIGEIKRYFPDIEDVESDRTDQDIATLTYSEYGRRLDILYSGTGLKHFLDVLLKTTVSAAQVVLLDEPELGLHPDLQRRFVEYLARLAKDKGVQFFLATHSQVLLNYSDSITYYRITNTKGQRKLVSVDRNAAATLLVDLGLRPSDVLNQDMCLLVEGATDVVFFEHVVRVLYADEFQKVGIAVLQYGGSAAEGIVSGSINVANIVPAQRFTFWIRDRDEVPTAQPSPNSTKFVNALRTAGLTAHIWNKREIEFYFPEAVLVAAQQGDAAKEQHVRAILSGNQSTKFREAASPLGVTVPTGQYLRKLLSTHLTEKSQLDQEIRDIVEGTLVPWRNEILGQ